MVLTPGAAVLYHWMTKRGNRPELWKVSGVMGLVGIGLLGLLVVFISHCVLQSIAISTAKKPFRLSILFWIGAMVARVAARFIDGFWTPLPVVIAFYSLRSLLQAHQILENSVAGSGRTFETHLNHHRRVFLTFFLITMGIGLLGLPWAARDMLVEVLIGAFVVAILLMETSLAKAMWRLGDRMQTE